MAQGQTGTVGQKAPKVLEAALAFVLAHILLLSAASRAGSQPAVAGAKKVGELPAAEPASPVSAGAWPSWRGPGGFGIRAEPLAVTHWSASKGIRWKVAVPGQGHASPVIFGAQVFVSSADERAQTQALIAYDRGTGALLPNAPSPRMRRI